MFCHGAFCSMLFLCGSNECLLGTGFSRSDRPEVLLLQNLSSNDSSWKFSYCSRAAQCLHMYCTTAVHRSRTCEQQSTFATAAKRLAHEQCSCDISIRLRRTSLPQNYRVSAYATMICMCCRGAKFYMFWHIRTMRSDIIGR